MAAEPTHSVVMNTPFTVALVLLVLLLGRGLRVRRRGRVGGGKPRAGGRRRRPRSPRRSRRSPRGSSGSAACASRRRPRPAEVSPAQAKRDGLEDLDRSYPEAKRHADEEVLKLLGLLEPSVDLRNVSATVFGQGVAGYYDPRTKRLRIVKGAQTTNRFLNEITLAHELTHALEDQRFGLDLEDTSGSDDAALARLALVEGSATAVMLTYGERHFSADQTLGGLFASLGQDTGDLPPFIEAQLLFPYLGGQAFVQRLFATGNNSWKLAQRRRPLPPARLDRAGPAPGQVPRGRAAAAVRARGRRRRAGGGRRLAAHRVRDLGRVGDGRAARQPRRPAEGWGGDHYELWQQPTGTCQAPCRQRDALVMRWRWDTPPRRPRVRDRPARVAPAPAGPERGRGDRPRGHARPRPDRRARTPPGPGLACAPRAGSSAVRAADS